MRRRLGRTGPAPTGADDSAGAAATGAPRRIGPAPTGTTDRAGAAATGATGRIGPALTGATGPALLIPTGATDHGPSMEADAGQNASSGGAGIAARTLRNLCRSSPLGSRDRNDGADGWMRSSGSY